MLYSPWVASLGFSQVRTDKRMLTMSQLLFPGRWAGHNEAGGQDLALRCPIKPLILCIAIYFPEFIVLKGYS